LRSLDDAEQRLARLCALHVIEQTVNVCQTTIVQNAWANGQELCVHGLIYDLQDGLLRDLQITIASRAELQPVYQKALAAFV
jgi:carbonic anhydrase